MNWKGMGICSPGLSEVSLLCGNWHGGTEERARISQSLRYRELYWLLGRTSPLSINNKLLLYKTVIAPIRTYGLELWGCASKSKIHVAIIQGFQSKLLRAIVNAPWYVTNAMIHSDLGISTVQDVIHDRSNKHRAKLQSHSNSLLQPLSRVTNIPRRLKRRWPADL